MQKLKVQKNHLMKEEFLIYIYLFPIIIHISRQKSFLKQKFSILILTKMEKYVWIYYMNNGVQHQLFRVWFYLFNHC